MKTPRVAKKPPSATDPRDTPTRILDAAELLFAEHGYDAVSVRSIMAQAPAQLGLLSYHFGTKESLLEAVVDRRAQTISNLRKGGLKALPAGSDSIEQLVEAYFGSLDSLVTGPDRGWQAYFRLISVLSQSDRWAYLLDRHFVPTSYLFIERLQRYAPDVPQSVVVRAWVFGISAALVMCARAGNIGVADGKPGDGITEADTRALIAFISGGLRAVLGLPAPQT